MNHVLLAYSGGLDTSVAIPLIQEKTGAAVSTLTVNVGQPEVFEPILKKARASGASRALLVDLREEFVRDFVFPALRANAVYEGAYPLATALARPPIARQLAETARSIGADAVAHGCTGKGNDQVRFEATLAALAPELPVIAPIRDLNLTREWELEYARRKSIPIEAQAKRYSIDENLWGRAVECGELEDPDTEPPEAAYAWTASPQTTPDAPRTVEIGFEAGLPVSVDGQSMDGQALIRTLNDLGGRHGVGRIDHIESRLVGLKSREVYEAPAASILLAAHRDLEKLTLSRDVLHAKAGIEGEYARLVYDGLWFSPLRTALQAFVDNTQGRVSGTARVKLFKGGLMVIGRTSPHSLYSQKLVSYSNSVFDQNAARGFIELFSMPLRVSARQRMRAAAEPDPAPAAAAGDKTGAEAEA